MKRFILILTVVLLLATMAAPAALAAASTTTAGSKLALLWPALPGVCPQRMCPDGSGSSCYCGGKLPPPVLS
ncbi:MAG: hypothetical protein NT169_23395 [Chloroflexi bacterium]|nr:hypothetical protein [Chloroflexota bacterium]